MNNSLEPIFAARLEGCVDIPPVIDFEASSLDTTLSYPISVGLVLGGRGYYWEIRPEQGWTDWSEDAEKLHGLTRSHLLKKGFPAEEVRQNINEVLVGHSALYSDAPGCERFWAGVLGLDTQIRNATELVNNMRGRYLKNTFEHLMRENGLRRHYALHDAVGLTLAVRHLR